MCRWICASWSFWYWNNKNSAVTILCGYWKKAAVSDFINNPQDIVIPLVKRNGNYVSLDGHTRLSVAIDRGFKCVKGFITDGGNWVDVFVNEAMKRGIKTPYDMKVLEHEEYDVKWNKFCDELFEE